MLAEAGREHRTASPPPGELSASARGAVPQLEEAEGNSFFSPGIVITLASSSSLSSP